jgi:copper chaperone CopZ
MTCSSCVNAVTRTLSRVPGVTSVDVDLDAGQARVIGNASPEDLVSAIEKAGYGARLARSENSAEKSHGRDGCC